MDTFPRYSYDPIQPDEIRLCRFAADENHVSAVLKVFPANAPSLRYTALSYTWGSQRPETGKQWHLKIGEEYLPALDSLRSFVQVLRSKGTLLDGTWWWIDSICIDQANIQERSEHVRQMKDIYRRAYRTIVWLGEKSGDSDRALDFIHSLDQLSRAGHSDKDLRILVNEQDNPLDWTAFQNFFLRQWWTRVWTVQEFVIPSRVRFLCGTRDVSRTAVCAALRAADRCTNTGFKDSIAFHHAWNRRRAWLLQKTMINSDRGVGLTLLALVAYFCSNEATDDRDRVYGLAALATEAHGLEVNYRWETDEVYLRFAQSFIEKHRSLDILSFASLFGGTDAASLPSWVPDWRARIQPLVIPLMVSQSTCSTIGNLRPPRTFEYTGASTRYSACGATTAVVAFEGSVLIARGLVIDEIDSIAGSETTQRTRNEESHTHPYERPRPPIEILQSICRTLVLDRKDRYLRYPMPTAQFYADFLNLCLLLITENPPHVVNKEFRSWFVSMASLHFNNQIETFITLLKKIQDKRAVPLSPPNQDEYIQDTFYCRFFDTHVRMGLRLMSSVKGRVGAVPGKARAGDLVCVFHGCSVPMLLRKCGDQERFTVVGECYLDGVMNGEALEQGGVEEVMFRIM